MASKAGVFEVNGVWYAMFYYRDHDGRNRQFRRSTGLSDKKGALALARKWKKAMDANGSVDTDPEPQGTSVPFTGYCVQWFDDYKSRWKESERRSKEAIIRIHLSPWFKQTDMRTIVPQDVARFVTQLLARKVGKKKAHPLSKKTANNVIVVLKRVFKAVFENGLLDRNIMAAFPIFKTPKPGYKFWREEQSDAFLRSVERHESADWFAFFTLALTTGARMGELAALRWGNVDFVEDTVAIERAVYKGKEDTPKGVDGRVVPLHPNAKTALLRARGLRHLDPNASDLIFTHVYEDEDGKRHSTFLDENKIKATFKRATRRAGLQEIRFHDLRHSFASQLAIRGKNLYLIGALLGHKHPVTTTRYAHLTRESLADAVADLYALKTPKPTGTARDESTDLIRV